MPCNFRAPSSRPTRGKSLWQADPAGAEFSCERPGFYGVTGAPVSSHVRPGHAKCHTNFFRSPSKLCAGSRSRIQVAESTNDSLRLVIKTAFSTQSRASPKGYEGNLSRGVEALKGD